MNIRILLTIVMLALMLSVSGQNPYLVLTYTAVDNNEYVQLDSIKVMNRTQGGDTVLFWPDTVLVLGSQFSTPEFDESGKELQVFQNYPNPVTDQTTISMYVPDRGNVRIIIADVTGRIIFISDQVLEEGCHSFRYMPGNHGLAFFTACWQDKTSSIRILANKSHSTGVGSLEYIGKEFLASPQKVATPMQNFTFNFGDTLLYIGYDDYLESGMLDTPEIDDTNTIQFATNIPCPGIPIVTYEGQVYNTIQIFNQCWLKENLNVGIVILGTQEMNDNSIIEKYCYNDEEVNCDIYGGRYQWDEVMQYTAQQGARGICPSGWHLPTDEEWKILEGAVDSQYGIGAQTWDYMTYNRGFDAGTNLKTTYGWNYGGNGLDLFGFSGLPGGYRSNSGGFIGIGDSDGWWASSEINTNYAWSRYIGYIYAQVGRFDNGDKNYGFSVRCLKN